MEYEGKVIIIKKSNFLKYFFSIRKKMDRSICNCYTANAAFILHILASESATPFSN